MARSEQTTLQSPFKLVFPVFDHFTESVGKFLSGRLVTADEMRLDELFLQGAISCNGQVCCYEKQCAAGDKIVVTLVGHYEAEVDTDWSLLWENDELLAVFKPHLLPVSRTTRNLYNTLISLVRRQTPYADARLLHRLDTETAGVILLAKDKAADKKWKPQLDQLITKKIYHATVSGVPAWDSKLMQCDLSEQLGSEIRSRVYVVDDAESDRYIKKRFSTTAFRVLQRSRDRSLIECELLTGRKHQIRSQLAWLGYPIIGDKIYSFNGRYYLKRIEQGLSDDDLSVLGSPYHRLVAKSLTVRVADRLVNISC